MKDIVIYAHVSLTDKLMFTKRLSVMLKAGINLDESLEVLAEEASNPAWRKVLNKSSAEIHNGSSLYDALSKYPKYFDQYFLSLIKVGEKTGNLDENLQFLAEQMRKAYALRKKIQSALMYPVFVMTAAAVIGGAITFLILPQLVGFFESLDIDLPFSTRVLIGVGKIVQNYGWEILIGLAVFIVVSILLYRIKQVKFAVHQLVMKIPLVKNIIIKGQLARYNRNLATLLSKGVPVTDSLRIAAQTIDNLKIQQDFLSIVPLVEQGQKINHAIVKKDFPYMPTMVTKMMSVGEQTGEFEEILMYLVDFHEDELDDLAKNLTSLLEPVMLVVIGLGIGFIAFSVISPIYQLTSGLR